MEEKIFIPQSNLSFDIQHFADLELDDGTIQISGTVEIADSLDGKTYITQGDDRDITFTFKKAASTEIDNISYSAKRGAKINVTSENVTLLSGTIEVEADSKFNNKNFVVDSSVTATFNLANTDSVMINDIVYTAKGNNCVVEIKRNKITLDGNFEITLAKGKSIELDGITFTADESNTKFIYNSTDGSITTSSGTLNVDFNDIITVDGVTYDGNGNLTFNDSLINVDGAFDIGNGDESLSGKKFAFNPDNDVTVNLAANDTGVKLNDATYTAGAYGLNLEYLSSEENIAIYGEGASVTGTGNFYLETVDSTVNINGIDFKNTDADAELQFTETDTVKISSAFTVGDGSTSISNLTIAADSEIAGSTFNLGSNGTVNVEGVTYKGNGTVEIGETAADITLSGSSISVGSADEDLSGKNFTFDSTCAATFAFNDSGSVKINGDTYSAADSTGGSVEVKAGGAVTVANSSVSFDTTSSATPKTLTISSGKDLTLNNIKYTAKNSDAKVTVDGTSVKIDSGTVAVDATSDFSVKLAENATAQIKGADFTKTESTRNSTDDISVQDGAITLNSKFTVGNGTQKLNNLVVTLTTSDESVFKLGTADSKITIIQDSGASYDVIETGTPLDGVTYTGSGTVTADATNNAATLDGSITVSGNNISSYSFTLKSGTNNNSNNTYTFGNASITPTAADATVRNVDVSANTLSVNGVSLTATSACNVTADLSSISSISTSGTVTVGSQTFTASGGEVTLSLTNGSVTSVSNNDANNVSVQIDSGEPYIIQSNGTLTSNGTGWSGGVTYTSYLYDNGTMWGIYDGGSETLAAGAYTDILNNGVLQSGKALTVKDSSISFGSYSYTVTGTAQFTGSGDGIDSIADGGSVTATATGAIDVQLGDNATLSKGVFTYTESGSGSSADINVAANGGVTASGEIEKQISSGDFTYKSATYTVDSAVTFKVDGSNLDGTYLQSGSGHRTASGNISVGGKNYSIDSGKYIAKGDTSGGYTAFSGTALYTASNGDTFTISNKNYTSTGNAIYKYESQGLQSGGTSTTLQSATGTRAFNATKDTETKTHGEYTYNVTAGTYTIEVTDGGGTETLTSGSATKTFTAGESLSYEIGSNTKDYSAEEGAKFNISFNNNNSTITNGTPSGFAKRTAAGETYSLTGTNAGDYILSSGAIMRLTLGETSSEDFYNGSATRQTTTYTNGTNTYTALGSDKLTLTWTMNSGTDGGVAFTNGDGTRQHNANETTFIYSGKNYTSSDIVYISHAGGADAIYSATGTSTDVTGDNKIVGSNTYNLTSGTYSINVVNDTTTATAVLDSAVGSTTVASNATFQITGDTNTYTAFGNAVNLNLSYSNNTDAETFTGNVTYNPAESSFTYSGETYNKTSTNVTYKKNGSSGARELYAATGTRSANGGSYTTTSVNTAYTLTNGTYETKITAGAADYKDKVISGNATQTIAQNGTFTLNNVEYTALNGSVTLNLSINDSTPLESFTGDATYNDATETSFSKNGHNYTKTSTNITYKKTNSDGAPSVYAAEGTRPYVTADGDTTTYKNDTYSVTAGTYKATVTAGTLTEALDTSTNRTAVFSTTNGTFHFNEKEYGATGYTTFKLTYGNSGTPSMSEASGKGTRTASGDSAIKVIYENDTYTTNDGSTIQIDITGPSASTESFLFGTATHTGSTFHYGGKEYTKTAGTITYTKASASATPTKTFSADSAGTRTESKTAAATFTFSDKIYSTTSTNVTYRASTQSAGTSLTEVVYAADGTRKADGTDKVIGAWNNEYTMPAGTGTVSITVATGSGTSVVTAGTATKTIAVSDTFTYSDRNIYTANKEVTLSLNVTGNGATKTENFTSGSASNGTSHIVKEGSQITIGDVTYTATDATQDDKIVNITGNSSNISALSNGKLTGDFADGKSATIGGIAYTATGASKLAINNTDLKQVSATGGTFTAEGNFSASGWKINNNDFQVTNDTNIKATFDSTGVTKIENLSGTAEVTAATTLTSIVTDGDGTFTIGGKVYTIDTEDNNGVTFTLNNGNVTKIQKTAGKGDGTYTVNGTKFVIDNDNVDGITFNLDGSCNVSKIEGLDRNSTGDYVKVTVGDSTTPIYLRRTSNTLEKTNGNWTEPEIVNFYVVTYDSTNGFKVKAVDNNGEKTLVNIENTDNVDYTISGTTLTFKADKKDKEIVVINETETNIKVNDVDGIGKTENSAIKIDTNGEFKLGTFSGTTFTPGITVGGQTISTEDIDIDSTKATFTVDSTGITVKPKSTTEAVIINTPKNSDVPLYIDGTGVYSINNTPPITISAGKFKVLFNDNGTVKGVDLVTDPDHVNDEENDDDDIIISIAPEGTTFLGGSPDLAEDINSLSFSTSHLLGESADESETDSDVYSYKTFTTGGVTIAVAGDDDELYSFKVGSKSGKLKGVVGLSKSAIFTVSAEITGFKITDDAGNTKEVNVAANQKYRYNPTSDSWITGEAPAVTATGQGETLTYKVTIENDRVALYYSKDGSTYTKTTNKADYTAAGLSVTPETDGGALPKVSGDLISTDGKITEVEITPSAAYASYTIAGKTLTLNGKTTLKATGTTTKTFENGIEVELGTQPITYDEMNFTGNGGSSKATLSSSGITLDANAKVTNVASKNFTAKGKVTFDDVTVTGISNDTAISAVTTNANDTTLTIGTSPDAKTLTVKGDAQYTVDAGAKKISGIGTGANITAKGYTIETNEVGNFTIGGAEFKTAGGDKKVTFKTNASGTVTEIADLDANESVRGNFATAIKVNGTAETNEVQVTGGNIGVVGGSSKISKIYGLNNNGVVTKDGGAATVSTAEAGTFQFGSTPNTYAISAGTADFVLSSSAVTGIKNIDGTATVSVYQDESALAVESDNIKITGSVDSTNGLKLVMGGDNIATVSGLVANGKIEGLSNGALVDVTGTRSVGINSSTANFEADKAATVYAATGGYDSVKVTNNNTTFTNIKNGAIVIPDAAGTYTFNSKKYEFSATPILKAGASNGLDSIGGLASGAVVTIYGTESGGLHIGKDTVKLTKGTNNGSTNSGGVKLTMGAGDTISKVESLEDGDIIEGLSNGALVSVTGDTAVKINTADFKADKAATVYAAAGGYDSVTGVAADTKFTNIKDGAIIIPTVAGSFIFGNTYTFSDKPTLVAGASNALASIGGLTNGQTVKLKAEESNGLYIGTNKVKLTKVGNAVEEVTFTMGDANTIKTVENLQDEVDGLSAGATVKVTSDGAVKINNKALQISDSDYSVIAASGGYSTIKGVAKNSTFTKVEDTSAIIIPDEAGKFTFGATGSQKVYEFDAIPTLKADGGALKEISLTGGQSVTLNSVETALKVGNNANLAVSGTVSNLKLTMDATGQNIATVENLQGGINNLNADAMVHMTGTNGAGSVAINSSSNNLEFSGNMGTGTITAHVTSGGYDYVKGLVGGTSAALAVTNAKNVSLVTAKQGKFTFGTRTYDISGDDEVTVKTDGSSQITEMDGITDALVTFSQAETALKINGRDVKVASGDVLKIDGNGVVSGITGTAAGGTYNLPGNVTIAVNASGTNGVTVNGKNLKVGTQDKVTVHTAADTVNGYDWVSGINAGAAITAIDGVSLVTAQQGTFTAQGNTYTTDDAQITLKTGEVSSNVIVTDIDGLDATRYLELNHEETDFGINGRKITIKGASTGTNDKVTITAGNNGTIASVKNLKGDVNGLAAGTLVEVKKGTGDISFNSSTANLNISDTEITVRVADGGYDYIEGLSGNANITTIKDNVSLVTDKTGTFTFANSKAFKTDDAQITLKTGVVSDATVVTGIYGLDADKYLELNHAESGLSVNGHLITVEGTDYANNQVTLTMGANDTISKVGNLRGNIKGLTAGAMVEVKTGDAIKFNSSDNTANLQIQEKDASGNDKTQITVRASNGGFDYIEGLTGNNTADKAPVVTTAKNVSIVTDGAGIFKFNGQTLKTDDAQVTLSTDDSSKVTAVGGLNPNQHLELYQNESGLSVNGHLITVTGAATTTGAQVTLTMGANDTISQVDNLRGNVYGLMSDANVNIKSDTADIKINSDSADLAFSGNPTGGTLKAHVTADGYDSITGLKGGISVTKAKENATLVTAAEGAFTFNVDNTADPDPTTKTFTTKGDDTVSFVMGAHNTLDGIYNLDGTVKGDFAESVKIEGKEVLITGDNEVSVVADGGEVTKIAGLTKNSTEGTAVVVKNSGGAEVISIDNGGGKFQFAETDGHSFSLKSGKADFLTGGDIPIVSGIKNIGDSEEILIYQSETSLVVEDNTLKITGVDANGITLKMSGDTIGTVENLKGEVSGLSAGATVNVATKDKVTINNTALEINEGNNAEGNNATAYKVIATADGYGVIKEVAAGSNELQILEATNSVIEISGVNNIAKSYKFGRDGDKKTFNIVDDSDQKVTVATDANTNVIAINGLHGTLKSNENNSTIRVNNVDVYSSSADVSIVANNTADQGISSVVGLTNNNMVNVPAGVAVQVNLNTPIEGVNDLIQFTINGTAYDLIGESDSISVKDKTIKGLDANARLTISGAEGNYKVNGTELTLSEGHNVVIGEATGAHLYEPGAIDFASFTPTDEIIERVFGEQVAAGIHPVDNANTTDESPGAVIVKTGNTTATLNKDKQLAVVKEAGTVNVSSTNDSVVASAGVTVNLNPGTNARLMQTAGTMTVTGYDYSTGAGIQLTNSDVVAAVRDSLTFDALNITNLGNGAAMNITYGANSNVVNLYDLNGKKTILNYASDASQTLNALQSSNASAILRGNWGTTNYSGLKLYGGNGNDTAFGGSGDYFNLGAGQNYIELADSHSGATIELESSYGATTVKGFDNSSANDTVKVDVTNTDAHYTDEGLVFTKGKASLTIEDVTATEASGGISYVNVMIDHSGDSADAVKTAVARDGMAIKVESNADTKAYVGYNSGIDLSDYTSGVEINLDTGEGKFGSNDVTFRGITSIKGGSGEHTLIGAADQSNTLAAGNGGGTIWGQGASGDLLIAADYSTDKSNETTFIFGSGDGADTVSNIQFYDLTDTQNNKNVKMDIVSIEGGSVIDVKTANNNVVIGINGSDSLTIKDAVGERFKANVDGAEYIVQVGKNEVTFDGALNNGETECYITSSTNGTLKISDSNLSENDINIINLNGTSSYTISDNIKSIDASASDKELKLIGNKYSDNVIKAGSGNSTLFGGNSPSNDTLYGGEGDDTFTYSIQSGMGNDVVENAGYGNDTVDFGKNTYSTGIKKIKSISVNEDSSVAVLTFTTGYTLTLKKGDNGDLSNVKFKFSNAEKDLVALQAKVNGSADLAENYWENGIYANELLDGDSSLVQSDSAALTFGNDVKNIAHSNGELWTGNVQYSLAGGEQVYNFSELVDKHNK